MVENRNVTENEISLLEIWDMLWSHKWLIALCTLAAAVLMFVNTMFFTVDTYTSDGVLYVSNHMEGAISSTYSVDVSDLDSARIMASTCTELLNTRSYLQYVSRSTGDKYTWEEIGAMTSVSSVNETELLAITVTADNPEDAHQICDAIIKKAPSQLGTIFSSGSIEIIDEASYPELPNSRGLYKKTLVGAVAGFVLGAVIAFILKMLDKTVRSSDEVANRYEIPFLGDIIQ